MHSRSLQSECTTMKHLTVRRVPDALARALEEEKERRDTSLNQVVLDLLIEALGVGPERERSNGLGRLAGTWSEAELEEFEAAVAVTERIDPEFWE